MSSEAAPPVEKKPSSRNVSRRDTGDYNPQNSQAWSATVPVFIGLLTLSVLLGGFGVWSVRAQLSGAIVAPGKIEVEQNRQVIQHPDGGVVSEILVREGDEVQKGDPLLRLDDTLLKSDLQVIEAQLFELIAKRSRLEAERDTLENIRFEPELLEIAQQDPGVNQHIEGQTSLFEARQEAIKNQRLQLQKRRDQSLSYIEGITAQLTAIEAQLELLREDLGNQQALLDNGLTRGSRVLELRREEARMAGVSGALVAQAAQSELQVTEIEIELVRLATDLREEAITELREIEPKLLELHARRDAVIERISRLDISSPVNGVAYDSSVFAERAVVRAAEPIMFIVPQDRPLLITAQVPTIDIDEVYPMQPVVLRFPAFDARTTPELNGHINGISADAFSDDRTGASFYRIRITIDEGELGKLPNNRTLVPGMPVEAYIRTQDYTPLYYLSKPLANYFTRAFRES